MADTENHRFLLGTNSFKRENEIHLINYSEDSNRIDQEAVFSFDNGNSEIWSISASPYNKDVFACGSHNVKDDSNSLNLFDLSSSLETSKDFNKKILKPKLTLGKDLHRSNIHSLVWEDCEPSSSGVGGCSQPKEIISADSEKAVVYDLQ